MLRHYLKLARKALTRNKYYMIITVFGLACGMLSALIIAKYIGGSLAFDNFHKNRDRIYSVVQQESIDHNPQGQINSTYPGVTRIARQFPEVIASTNYYQHVESLVMAEDKHGNRASFTENKIFVTDSAFLQIFSFKVLHGNGETALSAPHSVVLTKSTSTKYFGDSNPVGNALTIRVPWGAEQTYSVTAVVEDIPKKSRFTFNFLLAQGPAAEEDLWITPDCSSYLLLDERADKGELSQKLTHISNQGEQLKSTNRKVVLSLQRLADARLPAFEYLLGAVGILILIISWVNYINQVIAQSYGRMKEVGILRVFGATKKNLQIQFVVESCILCLSSMVIVVAAYWGIEDILQSFTNGHFLPLVGDRTMINLAFIAVYVIGAFLAAAIPTVIVFAQDFGTIVRNAYRSKVGTLRLRKTLVVLQFSISSVLVICIFVIRDQLAFMKNKDKGFDPENILVVKAPIIKGTWGERTEALELLKDRCRQLPNVSAVTSSTTVPGEEYRHETYISFEDRNEKTLVHQSLVDEYFFDLYRVKFVAGQNFLPHARSINRSGIILNESAARGLGIADLKGALNAKIRDHESDKVYDLIGIVKDFHQTSLKYEMRPMAFRYDITRGNLSLGIRNARPDDVDVAAIKNIWAQVYPDAAFDYFFLIDRFESQDNEDRYFGDLFQYFTALSVILSCLGLFSLSHLISTKRLREIGIRKVFGASSLKIVALFLRGYLPSLTISVFIGVSAAYWLMTMWLRNYAYRVEIAFELIAMAIVSLVVLFLLTITYHTVRSSLTNPAAILKD